VTQPTSQWPARGQYVSIQNPSSEDFAAWLSSAALSEVDKYGVPLDAFGSGVPPEFFEVLGRLLAVNGKIEYLKERLDDLPSSETSGVRKANNLTRGMTRGLERNAIVHSLWVFGAHTEDPQLILGVRYKTKSPASGEIATVSIRDVPHSEREQVIVQYKLDRLRKATEELRHHDGHRHACAHRGRRELGSPAVLDGRRGLVLAFETAGRRDDVILPRPSPTASARLRAR
jgi:hypothetical protein